MIGFLIRGNLDTVTERRPCEDKGRRQPSTNQRGFSEKKFNPSTP